MSTPPPQAPNPVHLSRRERQIMEIVYARSSPPGHGASASDVLQDLAPPPPPPPPTPPTPPTAAKRPPTPPPQKSGG
jgi:hypothetical protein